MRTGFFLAVILLAAPMLAQQRPAKRVFYFPRPVNRAPYPAPMKPVVRLADLKAKYYGQTNWSEVVVADRNTRAQVISAAPGSKLRRHLHADSPHWWVVQEGRIRFEIEGPDGKLETYEARKGSYVFAPERHLHSLEVIGTEPAIRMDVTLADATPIYDSLPEGVGRGEIEFLPVTLDTGPHPLEVPATWGRAERRHVNIEDLEAAHRDRSSWTEPAMRQNRVRGNFIYGHARNNPKPAPGYRGHMHADFAEFWIVLRGRLRWMLEGVPEPVIAGEGDIVYAPPNTFHHIEFYGDGPACRLTSSTYPSANHLYDAPH
jgi:mannose-6-phosphate isomerase-like protein (cupin superfamily)